MNRRQKKKAYKKKYGQNPPKSEIKYYYRNWSKVLNRTVPKLAAAMIEVAEYVQRVVRKSFEATKEIIERIQTMPEEEFNRILEESGVDEETKKIAIRIRRGKE